MRRNQLGCRAHPPGQACECHFAPLSTLNKLELFCAGPGARQLGAQGAVQRGAVYSYLLTLGSARAWQKNINDCKPQQSRVLTQGPPPPPLDSNSPLFSTPQRVSRRPFVSWSLVSTGRSRRCRKASAPLAQHVVDLKMCMYCTECMLCCACLFVRAGVLCAALRTHADCAWPVRCT